MQFQQKKKDKPESLFRYVSLGGVGEVNKNMHLYESGGEILVVDCGVEFPDAETPGVDVVIPDFSYLVKNRQRVRAILITHGHEDHLGALPYLLGQINVPVYSSRLVRGFIASKLEEFQLGGKADLRLIDPEGESVTLGPFRVSAFRINHSVPDSVGFCLETASGKYFHVADFKFDWSPVMDKPFDVHRLLDLCHGGVTALFSDCLGAASDGYTRSEKNIEGVFDRIISQAAGQVFLTTISSNISRMQQAINASLRYNRRICFVGHSIEKFSEVAQELGFLKFPKKMIVNVPHSLDFSPRDVTYIISGCYGQPESALGRVGRGEHRFLSLKKGATVIFSGDPSPPGAKESVDTLVDQLTALGANVHYYETQEDLHTSGHGSERELAMLAALVRPKYFVPIGGTTRHIFAYQKMIEDLGFPAASVFRLMPGQFLNFSVRGAHIGEKLNLSGVYIDGSGLGDIGGQVLRERQIMANGGLLVINILIQNGQFSGRLFLLSRGFVSADPSLFPQIEKLVRELIRGDVKTENRHILVKNLKRDLSKFLSRKVERHPLILVNFLEV